MRITYPLGKTIACILLTILPLSSYFAAYSSNQVAIYDIQFTEDPSGDSPYANQTVTVTGIVTGIFYDGYTIAEVPALWQAIFVHSNKNGPHIGDEVEVTGTVAEYYGMTEIRDVSNYQLLSSGHSVDAIATSADSASQEGYESVLITLDGLTVTSTEDFGEWVIHDGSASIRFGDRNDYMYFPQVGDYLDTVTGILFYTYNNYKIEPRSTSDISGDIILHYALKGHIVTMNDNRDVWLNAYVEILGDRILNIHLDQPSGIQIVETGGLIFPGLIDAHNHPAFNVLDVIPFEDTYSDRYEWQSLPLYDDFIDQYYDIRNHGGDSAQFANAYKLAELRALIAGTTMMQGWNSNGHEYDTFAHQGMVINNAERFPSRIYSNVFPLTKDVSYWQAKSDEFWDRFVIHLSEGTNEAALEEFYAWQNMGMLDWRTSIIHGVPYGSAEWSAMADANAHLIWSPMSNLRLYETTADVPGALAAGVNVALAPDWTESGSPNLLEEMKYANYINKELWGGTITPLQFAEFVTRNAAYALGMQDWAGQIVPGYQADIMVISGNPQSLYQALLDAEPVDVKLTVVSGRPMYGDPELMELFSFLTEMEDIRIWGKSKKLAIQIEAHGIPDSDKPVVGIIDELKSAYKASSPKICNFLGITDQTPPAPLAPTTEETRWALIGGVIGGVVGVGLFIFFLRRRTSA